MQSKKGPFSIPESYELIPNIFTDFPDYNCFVCSPFHESGFRLKFYHDPEKNRVVSPVFAPESMAGFPRILHGGFQSMLLDEILFWTIYQLCGKLTVTASLNIKFQKTVPTETPFLVYGELMKASGRIFKVQGGIEQNGLLLTQGEGVFIQPSLEAFQEMAGTKEVPSSFLPLFERD